MYTVSAHLFDFSTLINNLINEGSFSITFFMAWILMDCVLFSVSSRTFHLYIVVIIASEWLQNLGSARVLWPLNREGSLLCHTCCGTLVYMVPSKRLPCLVIAYDKRGIPYWGPKLSIGIFNTNLYWDACLLLVYTIFTIFQFSNLLPDYVITGQDFRLKGPGGFLCAGFYGNQWEYRKEISSCVCWKSPIFYCSYHD